MINIRNLIFGYEGSYENVFENVNLQLDTSWKLGLTGRNGRGKHDSHFCDTIVTKQILMDNGVL